MKGTALLWLPDVLRAAGLSVILQPGWESRARTAGGFTGGAPYAVAWHHTASDATPKRDSDYMSFISPTRPIANIMPTRDGTVWVLAAGQTNTNGAGIPMEFSRGRVPANSANSLVVGMEICNDGVGQSYPQVQIDAAFKASNAINGWLGNQPEDVFSHHHYAPTRKIDPATARAVQGPWDPSSVSMSGSWSLADLRKECKARAPQQPPPPPPPEGDLMYTLFDLAPGHTFGGYMDANGIFGQVTWLSPTRAQACLAHNAPHIGTLDPGDMGNTDLLGACPDGIDPHIFDNVFTASSS